MSISGSGARVQAYKMQADALVNMSGGTPPASGTKYEWSSDGTVANAIGTQYNVRIYSIAVKCTWTVQPTPLEVWVTVDGQTSHKGFFNNPVSDQVYYHKIASDEVEDELVTTDPSLTRVFDFEGRAVKLEFEITGGTVSALNARIKWAKVT